jgi:hypothetical protein
MGGDSEVGWNSILFTFVVAVAFAFFAYLGKKDQILIPTLNNGLIEIFNERPTKDATDKFISTLNEKINSYLIKKYASIDKDLPIEPQLSQLMWLREREILKEEEFENLKLQLLGKKESSPIGFKN